MSKILQEVISELESVLQGKVDSAHGIDHSVVVLSHVEKALEHCTEPLTEDEKLAVLLAALLHDADDRKFFQGTNNAENILSKCVEPHVGKLALYMINLVSCSKNGNSKEGVEYDWMLYPRYADRLEALGEIGIWRCWQYTSHVKRPVFTETTERAQTREELQKIANADRFRNYVEKRGKVGSSSFIDHFYDKLLHISDCGENPYFKNEVEQRIRIMEDFLIDFGQRGEINSEMINRLSDKFHSHPK